MKNILFIALLVLGICNTSYGQNRSIKFEKGTWKEVLKKAKKTKQIGFPRLLHLLVWAL